MNDTGNAIGRRLRPKRRFGQVFLSDPRHVSKILAAVGDRTGRTLLEIGPGEGALTEKLSEMCTNLVAVEIDTEALALLAQRLAGCSNVKLVHADILRTDLRAILGGTGGTVVGNLPYNIAARILIKLVENRLHVSEALVMVQREVGERITSPPHRRSYSFLSVAVQTFARAKRLFLLPPGAFRPPPKVESAFLRLSFNGAGPLAPERTREYLDFVGYAFSQRRKKVFKLLSKKYSQHILNQCFKNRNLDPNARAENLTVDDFVALFDTLFPL